MVANQDPADHVHASSFATPLDGTTPPLESLSGNPSVWHVRITGFVSVP